MSTLDKRLNTEGKFRPMWIRTDRQLAGVCEVDRKQCRVVQAICSNLAISCPSVTVSCVQRRTQHRYHGPLERLRDGPSTHRLSSLPKANASKKLNLRKLGISLSGTEPRPRSVTHLTGHLPQCVGTSLQTADRQPDGTQKPSTRNHTGCWRRPRSCCRRQSFD